MKSYSNLDEGFWKRFRKRFLYCLFYNPVSHDDQGKWYWSWEKCFTGRAYGALFSIVVIFIPFFVYVYSNRVWKYSSELSFILAIITCFFMIFIIFLIYVYWDSKQQKKLIEREKSYEIR